MSNNKKLPLMPKSTAMWLIDNTCVSFKQIADFCGLHELEVQGMADGDVASNIIGRNPIENKQLTKENIEECEKDPTKELVLMKQISDDIEVKKTRKNTTYVPMARRGDKPDGIMYLLKNYPSITDQQIRKLFNTTTPMIDSIRNRTHWNIKEIKPRDPVLLGLCSQTQFNAVVKEIENNSNNNSNIDNNNNN